jgi:hypothetical protein
MSPISPVRRAVPAAKAAISPMSREGSTVADQRQGWRGRDCVLNGFVNLAPLARASGRKVAEQMS